MLELNKLETVIDFINSNDIVLLYFRGERCSVCKALKPKIEKTITTKFPKIKMLEIKTDKAGELASYFSVFTNPIILIYIEKKEFFRKGAYISISEFTKELRRPYSIYVSS